LDGRRMLFTASAGPYFRGMLVDTTVEAKKGVSSTVINYALGQAYKDEPFVKVLPDGKMPTQEDIKHIAGKDFCVVGSTVEDGVVRIVSIIDNLRKGAATQAVQGFNIMNGFEETSGLTAA